MPDISLCRNRSCTKRLKCFRYRAVPDRWQSYADYEQDANGFCPDFVQIWPRSVVAPIDPKDLGRPA